MGCELLTPPRRTLSQRLLSVLNIRTGEGSRIAWMMLYSGAAIGGFLTVGLAAASALFLATLPASATPFVFIASGASSIVVFLLYSLAVSRLRMNALVLGSDLLLLALALILRLLLSTRYGQSFPVLLTLFLFIDAGSTLVITQFWVRAAQIFDPRQAKRLFGLIAAGGTVSATLAGLVLRSGVTLIGVNNLLLIVAASLVVCILCARSLERIQWEAGSPAGVRATLKGEKTERSSILQDLRAILHSPLLLAISGLTILIALLINTGAYQYFLALQVIYAGRGEQMVGFLGMFQVFTGVTALFMQLYLTGRVMRRLGLFGALIFFALAMAVGAGLALATGGALLAMALVRAADPIFRQTINQSAMTVLYLPVPTGLRQRAKTILEIGYALSFGLLGVVFLASQRIPGWSYVTWSYPVLGFVALWLILLRWGRPQYRRALGENLRKRRLDFANATIDISDETTVQVLAATLKSPDELLVVHTLGLLAHARRVDWTPHVSPLLAHPSPEVRTLALRHLEQAGKAEELPKPVAAVLKAPECDVRAAAVSAVSAIGGPLADDLIAPFLDDPSPAVRGAALAALSRHGDPKWEKAVAFRLNALLESEDPGQRCEGARAIGAIGRPENAALLLPLFGNDVPATVRINAMRAAGALRSRSLLSPLIAGLGLRPLAAEAADALALYGPGIESDLEAALNDSALPPAVRSRIPAVLGQLNTRAATEILGSHIREHEDSVRFGVFYALARKCPLSPSLCKELGQALLAEIREHYRLYVLRADLQESEEGSLLGEAIAARLRGSLDRMCLLLRLINPDGRLSGLRPSLESGQGKERSMAIELLDTLLAGECKALLIPALEGPPERILAIAGKRLGIQRESVRDRLAGLAEGSDSWLRACAAARIGGTMALPIVERVLFLKSADIFSQLNSEDLVPVAERAQEVHFGAGETFIHQDEPGDCLYLIVDGEASIVVRGVGQIGTRGPKGAIGEMAIVWRRPRSADCVALTDITALKIDYEDFWELMDERPALGQGVIKVLAQRLDAAMESLQRVRHE